MNAADARRELERILGSPGFDASARNRRFLEYIVEETLAGRADRLKGTSIAIDCILGVGMTQRLVYLGRHSWVRYARGRNGQVVAVPEAGVGSEPA